MFIIPGLWFVSWKFKVSSSRQFPSAAGESFILVQTHWHMMTWLCYTSKILMKVLVTKTSHFMYLCQNVFIKFINIMRYIFNFIWANLS